MSTFSYRARDEKGTLITGTMDADSQRAVYSHLDNQGLIPVAVAEEKGSSSGAGSSSLQSFLRGYQKVKYDDIIFFTRQLQTIIKAGIPLISGLKALEEQTMNARLKDIIKEIYQDIDKGTSFSDALSKHDSVFPEIYVSMVRAGEIGGVLDDVLERLCATMEFQMKTKEMLKTAMRYPVMVVSALIAAFVVVIVFVIPKFAVIFKGAKMELPLPTRIMLLINDVAQNYGLIILGVIILSIVLFVLYIRTEKGLLNYDRFKLKVPFIGQILLKISMSRFANMFENMIRTGVPIIRTFEIVARTVGNQYIASKIVEIGIKVEKGKGITKPMREAQIFPPLVMHMMSTGEDTGSLEEMLGEITRHYDREITYSIGRLSSLIEPILTAGLSVMVLFLALAIFLPWWNMMDAMKGGGP